MLATQVKQAVNTESGNKTFNPKLVKKIDKAEVEATKAIELSKSQSFNRFLEAYGDCV